MIRRRLPIVPEYLTSDIFLKHVSSSKGSDSAILHFVSQNYSIDTNLENGLLLFNTFYNKKVYAIIVPMPYK